MTLRGLRNIIVSVGLGGLFLWLTFKGLDLNGLRTAFNGVNWWYLLLYLVILTAIQFIRVLRWGLMLEPVKKVSFKTLYAVSSVGFMALVLLPFRLGEFARPYLINMKAGISVSAGVATIVVERIIDAITISFVLAVTIVVLIAGGFNVPGWIVDSGVIFFTIFFVILAICVLMYLRPSLTEKICEGMFGWFSKSLADKAIAISREFIKGLKILP
ncbi:MAG: lysylphosphatidylglycerol synthase transmembrane domain-containing protein, partial [Candidatus Omnitrophota bacterium]